MLYLPQKLDIVAGRHIDILNCIQTVITQLNRHKYVLKLTDIVVLHSRLNSQASQAGLTHVQVDSWRYIPALSVLCCDVNYLMVPGYLLMCSKQFICYQMLVIVGSNVAWQMGNNFIISKQFYWATLPLKNFGPYNNPHST